MMLERELKNLSDEIVDMLIRKNQDYDNAFFKLLEKYGDLVFLIHLEEKMQRLSSLINKEPNFEKKEDTIKDIIGYCLLYITYKRGKT